MGDSSPHMYTIMRSSSLTRAASEHLHRRSSGVDGGDPAPAPVPAPITLPPARTPLLDAEEQIAAADAADESKDTGGAQTLPFVVMCTCLLVVNTTFSILVPIFPQAAALRGLDPAEVGLVFSSFPFVSFLLSPVFGRFLQLRYIQRRVLLVVGLLVCGTATALFGGVSRLMQHNTFLPACLLLRMLQGAGSAAVDTASFAIIANLYGGTSFFGMAMGFAESALSCGWIFGPMLAGLVARTLGFGAPFFITAGVTLAFCPVPFTLLPAEGGGEATGANEEGAPPVSAGTLLRQPLLLALLGAGMLAAFGFGVIDPSLGPFMIAHFGYNEVAVGLAFGLIGSVYTIMTPIVGWAGDMVGHMAVIQAGQVITAVAYILLGPAPFIGEFLDRQHQVPLFWCTLVALGLGSGTNFVPVLPALLEAINEMGLAREGVEDLASGLLSGAFYMGGALGPLAGGAATSWLGFPWTGCLMAAALLLACLLLGAAAGASGFCCGPRKHTNPGDGTLEEVPLNIGTEE